MPLIIHAHNVVCMLTKQSPCLFLNRCSVIQNVLSCMPLISNFDLLLGNLTYFLIHFLGCCSCLSRFNVINGLNCRGLLLFMLHVIQVFNWLQPVAQALNTQDFNATQTRCICNVMHVVGWCLLGPIQVYHNTVYSPQLPSL